MACWREGVAGSRLGLQPGVVAAATIAAVSCCSMLRKRPLQHTRAPHLNSCFPPHPTPCAAAEDVLVHSPRAGLLRPAYCVVLDTEARSIILCIRGTHSRQDMFTSLTSE